MPASPALTFDFNRAAAVHFSDRPTLRQVVSEQLLKVLLVELPWLASVQPALSSADALMLDSPDPSTAYWTTQPLVDRILQALLQSNTVDLEPVDGRHYNLGLVDPYRFPGSDSAFDTRSLTGLTAPLNALIEQIPESFCLAQLGYWTGIGNAGVSRDQWIQLLLKTALQRGLPLQGLDAQEQACIRGLVRGSSDQPWVSFVQASLTTGSHSWDIMLCHLLVTGEWDERQVVMWCSPSGSVRGFESLAAFAVALRDELALSYQFDEMSWQQYPVDGNVFAQQAALLLDTMFTQVDRVRYGRLADVAALEQLFAQLSDPAQWFASYPNDTAAVPPPLGVRASSGSDSFAYQTALQQLAAMQQDADGVAALDGVQSLQTYTWQRLGEQIRLKYSDDTSPDDLILEFSVARGVPGGAGAGAGGGEPLEIAGQRNLTEFAIGNLGALKGAVISRLRRSNGEAAPAWLDADAVNQLVREVDIGGTYPAYVAAQLNDPQQRPQRVKRFAREWRSSLWFSALGAKLDAKITDVGLQAVVDFCAGHLDPLLPRVVLMPLAFRRQPDSRLHDPVRGMYVLICGEPGRVLLYRPLYKQDTLREYANFDALLEHIQQSPLLQASILEWMDPQVRHIYDHGGFREPHVGSIGTDPYDLPERPGPPVIHVQYWLKDLDEHLYNANRDLLVELADMQSESNVERRWETLAQGAWLLFDVVTLVLRGPVATVAWLAQLLGSLEHDLQALEQQGEFGRSAAAADLLLNLGMTLLHLHQPSAPAVADAMPVDASAFEGPASQYGTFAEVSVLPSTKPSATLGELAALPGRQLDLSWRGNQGFNWIAPAQRQALRAMRSSVSLHESALLSTGEAAGLYQIDGQLYAAMAGDAYPVELVDGGVRVMDGNGGYGPWLVSTMDTWRVDQSLRLAGGMRRGGARAKLVERFFNLQRTADEFTLRTNEASDQFTQRALEVTELRGKVDKLRVLRDAEQARQSSLEGNDLQDSVALVARYDARLAEWNTQILIKRDESIRFLESAVLADEQVLMNYGILQEPKFATLRRSGLDQHLPAETLRVQNFLIRNNEFILKDLWDLVDYPGLVELQAQLDGRPIGQVRETYAQYRQKLERTVAFQDRMLKASGNLDVLLADTPAERVIALSETNAVTVAQMIARRTISTVQLRFHQALNLADMALHLDTPVGQHRIARYRDDLAGLALRNAAGAHGELDFANLSVEDRISILQEAWDEYAAALLNCKRIRDEGGELIEVDMLDRYRLELERLKLDAGTRVANAIQEQEGGGMVPRRVAYAVTNERQHVVRNSEGQILIGTVRELEGQQLLEVRDSFDSTVLATFDWRDGEWHERLTEEPQPPAEPEDAPTDAAMHVQGLLDENDVLISKAAEYVENDIKAALLTRLFDRQMKKLSGEAARLIGENANPALIRSVEAAADRLRTEKQLKLITLYTKTSYPTAEALRFLHGQQLLKVVYAGPRQVMRNGTTFDEYHIQRLTQPGDNSGRPIWVAHFHMPSADALAREFTVGHLKTWSQRRQSSQPGSNVRVHRGKLTLEQANGIIPFD
ncbi:MULTISPECIES: dermonecrotic toxin domain-containing protein [unclassified Pseudomonas]|uniref:dermonecrotic toxin domain-containing protein n=1 Tax=unclassified Pseudomonas TaxID=196821 RepID=UPI000480F281|nr:MULTISPECIES: DUF6543 domain-containing protein [unclassified Pseudomonas]RAS25716.1 hypothetical protein H040_03123 [Pseudomonas sp. URMO17WK12:I7]SMF31715.1 hypothetical protein SAMN02745903_02789 [Pseudomonas sp. URMO17WK12:I5]